MPFAPCSSSKDDHLPSPPSSMLNTTVEEVTEEGKTEVTMVEPDSLYLEIAPDPYVSTFDNDDIDVDDVNVEDLVEGARDKVPYDLSISSENEVTNKENLDNSDEGSLHDSMEILEEIATEDHFEHDNDDSDPSEAENEPKDIFEMPPMPNTISSTEDPARTSTPPSGGNEFIF